MQTDEGIRCKTLNEATIFASTLTLIIHKKNKSVTINAWNLDTLVSTLFRKAKQEQSHSKQQRPYFAKKFEVGQNSLVVIAKANFRHA